MRTKIWLAATAAIGLSLSLAACSGASPTPGDVLPPITMDVNDLQGENVKLTVGQVLNINTASLDVDSYTGTVSDTAVAEFTPGRKDGSAEFNPGVTALAEGQADVRMVNDQGGIQPLDFTVTVVPKQ